MSDQETNGQPADEMPHFVDLQGHVWHLWVDWAAMRRASAAGVDLSQVEIHLGDFYRGSPKLADALWSVVADSAKAANLDQDGFEQRVRGRVIPDAVEALVGALENFFPPDRAELMRLGLREVQNDFAGLSEQLQKLHTASPVESE